MNFRSLFSLSLAALIFSSAAQADMYGTVIGGGVGAVAGAVIGDSVGGHNGAIIGSGVGAAVGAAVGQQVSRERAHRPPTYYPAPQVRYVPVQYVEYRYYDRPGWNHGQGHYKHKHRHDHHGYHH